jgi:DNA invertase Pin-like site-specific DNA recombinase
MKVIAYCRVSTNRQATEGLSLEAQRAKLEAYAQLYDHEIIEVCVDAGVSAKDLNRPGVKRALELLDSGEADGLLVVKLDRLTRSTRDLANLIDRYFMGGKLALISVNESLDTKSAAGRLVLGILGVVSQWEREATAERTKEVKIHQKRLGRFLGGAVPYGYTVGEDGQLERDEGEQVIVDHIVEWRTAGLSYREIAGELSDHGMTTRNGGDWSPALVWNVAKQNGLNGPESEGER